jgi:hypothetical protein
LSAEFRSFVCTFACVAVRLLHDALCFSTFGVWCERTSTAHYTQAFKAVHRYMNNRISF